MTTMEENGIKVEASTPAAAVRAMKKERARMERAARIANERAYAALGWLASCSMSLGEKITDAQRAERVKLDGNGFDVRLSSARNGDAVGHYYLSRCVGIFERADGTSSVIEIEDTFGHRGIKAYAIGIEDGFVSLVQVPDYVAEKIREPGFSAY